MKKTKIKPIVAWAVVGKSPTAEGFLLNNEHYKIYTSKGNAVISMPEINGVEIKIIKVKISPL